MSFKHKKKDKDASRYCELCYLQEKNSPNIPFYMYSEGMSTIIDDKYVCEKCLNWVKMIRNLANKNTDSPDSKIFKNISWWWQPKEEGTSAMEVEVR